MGGLRRGVEGRNSGVCLIYVWVGNKIIPLRMKENVHSLGGGSHPQTSHCVRSRHV